jgi:hypothetical protein
VIFDAARSAASKITPKTAASAALRSGKRENAEQLPAYASVQIPIVGREFRAEARKKKCFWLPRYARQPKTPSKIAALAALVGASGRTLNSYPPIGL